MNVYANLIELDDSEIMKGVVVFRNNCSPKEAEEFLNMFRIIPVF